MKFLQKILILSIAILGLMFVDVNAQSFSDSGRSSVRSIERQVFKQIIHRIRKSLPVPAKLPFHLFNHQDEKNLPRI